MGRRGQGEMAEARVSSDAMPALTGSRCVGTGQSGRSFPANKVVPQKSYFLSLFPQGNEDIFLLGGIFHDQETTRQAMVIPK